MSKLTKEAKAYCQAVVETWDRDTIVAVLEGTGTACYDDEDIDTLVEAVVEQIESGDVGFDFSYGHSRNFPHHIQMLNLDMNEVWE